MLRDALALYLFAYVAVVSLAVGALLQVLISDLTGARWFDPLRPLAMRIAHWIWILAPLTLPILIGATVLYPWAHPALLTADAQAIVERKHAWLNVPFFAIRSIVYLAVFCLVERWRARRTEGGSRAVSAVGVIAVGFALTFASFDWVMSLEPTWYSTVFGVYVFASGILAALGLIAFLTYRGRADSSAEENTRASLGKLMLTFAIFWAYIAFSQYVIIWIGDLPSEVMWYLSRTHTAWVIVAVLAGLGLFVLPSVALLSYSTKRQARVLALVGITIVVAHVLDTLWLVMPSVMSFGVR